MTTARDTEMQREEMTMDIRLTIRAGGEVMAWTANDWRVLLALEAVSAGPETIPELFAALRRNQPDHTWESQGWKAAVENAFCEDGPACLIDFDSRSVLAGGGFELPDRYDALQADEEDHAEGFHVVWLNIPADWLFGTAADDWLSVIGDRAKGLAGRRSLDTRAVLYGEPMFSFIADGVAAVVKPGDDEYRYEQIRAIHAQWLMTPRDELLGQTPREVLLRNRHQIGLDIQHRSDQWSMQGSAPPPLGVDTAAYRFGGYGTVEILMYFDLMRSLLDCLWDWTQESGLPREALLKRLAEHRESFLKQPPEGEGSKLTVRELIESERRRMPLTADGSHLDCDCPVCQAVADGELGRRPMFMFYDGHQLELEDEFAFSMIETREKWEEDQREFERFNEKFNREQAEREASGESPESAWTSSFVDWDNIVGEGDPAVSGKMAIGFLLAEIISHLKQTDGGQTHIEALNQAYADFRRADDPIAEKSAAQALGTSLENAAQTNPDLTPKAADLQSRIDELLRAGSSE